MRFQTAPYTEKRHVTQRREKQKTTGEKKKGRRVDFWSNQCGNRVSSWRLERTVCTKSVFACNFRLLFCFGNINKKKHRMGGILGLWRVFADPAFV